MSLFEGIAARTDAVRRFMILADAPRRRPRRPDPYDGFVPPREAAAVMGIDEDAVLLMVRQGALEGYRSSRELLVRPAIVNTLGIRA
jgi:hypothetical protein